MFGRKNNASQTKAALLEPVVPEAVDPMDEASEAAIWSPTTAPQRRKTVEDLLLESGVINDQQLLQARTTQAQSAGKSVAQILVSMNVAAEAQVLGALAETMGLAFVTPDKANVDERTFELLTADYCRAKNVLPIRQEDGKLLLAVTDPTNVFLIDEARRRVQKDLQIAVTTAADIVRVVEQLKVPDTVDTSVSDIIKDMAEDDVELVQEKTEDASDANDLEKAGNESPVIRFVNYLIADALKQGASDIHIEPKEKTLKVRYRIDGVLFEAMNPPHAMGAAITSRLKIMGNLDISERRLPQDGRIRATVQGRKVDLRLSTLPTANGEKSVIRILDNRSISVPLEALGFSEHVLTIWKNQIDQPHGILLVTGPTGSGKTTTLYSSLRVMNGNELNISTVEDPIEYQLDQANQVQVHEKIGMSFSAALRSLLRQDPDVIMLGEIRDAETARIAVQAALTGHLVLSTLHTNDAPSSVTRLINIGVEPYLISSAVNAILAQRLVRKICGKCKTQVKPTPEMREFLDLQGFKDELIWKGEGCDKCRKTGHTGRLGIYELLVMDDSLRDMVTANPDVNQLRKLCRERGLVTLREDGFAKAQQGMTTIDEVLRVTEASL
jgi:type IV pilus assembly protein PilB